MVDALSPAIDAFERGLRSGEDLRGAAGRARTAAEEGMRATIPMQARKGRASYLGQRSVGHQDPGATSTAALIGALERAAGEDP
jgi:dihydroxyacetone kinase-like protein